MPSSDVIDFSEMGAARFDNREVRLTSSQESINSWLYGHTAIDSPDSYLSHGFSGHVKNDPVSRVLRQLAKRLTTRPATPDAELRYYGVPLSEVFKAAGSEYTSISIDPEVMAGAPCVRGSRIPVYGILDALEDHGSFDGVMKSYPRLSWDQIKDAIGFARLVVECPIDE